MMIFFCLRQLSTRGGMFEGQMGLRFDVRKSLLTIVSSHFPLLCFKKQEELIFEIKLNHSEVK